MGNKSSHTPPSYKEIFGDQFNEKQQPIINNPIDLKKPLPLDSLQIKQQAYYAKLERDAALKAQKKEREIALYKTRQADYYKKCYEQFCVGIIPYINKKILNNLGSTHIDVHIAWYFHTIYPEKFRKCYQTKELDTIYLNRAFAFVVASYDRYTTEQSLGFHTIIYLPDTTVANNMIADKKRYTRYSIITRDTT